MTRIAQSLAAAVLAGSFGGLVAAQSPNLDVKLGLWETTMTMDASGMPPGVDTSKMTPEQQAQMATMMRGRSMAPTTVKSCMTKEKLADHKYMSDRPGQTCTRTVTKSTTTTLDMTQVCTGTSPMTSEMHIEALSTTSLKMTAKQTNTSGRGGQVTVNMTSKWIGADCGDVK